MKLLTQELIVHFLGTFPAEGEYKCGVSVSIYDVCGIHLE